MIPFPRITTVTLFIALHAYWRIKHKGLSQIFDFGKQPFVDIFHKSLFSYAQVFVLLQLIGFTILPTANYAPIIGNFALMLVIIGFLICISARHVLGKNWTNAKDYRRTNKHQLVTNGIYRYIRHPIYLGLNMMITGAEILAQSYVLALLPLLYFWTYKQAKREENFLIDNFGDKYKSYQSKTKMIIPNIL